MAGVTVSTMPLEPLLDPTGRDRVVSTSVLSPRLRSLRGKRLALLENTKPNAAVVLNEVATQLRRHGVETVELHAKSYFGTPVDEALMQRILTSSDFAIAGIGD